jgi:hypothetical protein
MGRLWRWIKDNWKGYWKASSNHAAFKIDRELGAQKKKGKKKQQ